MLPSGEPPLSFKPLHGTASRLLANWARLSAWSPSTGGLQCACLRQPLAEPARSEAILRSKGSARAGAARPTFGVILSELVALQQEEQGLSPDCTPPDLVK